MGNPSVSTSFFVRLRQAVTIENKHKNIIGENPMLNSKASLKNKHSRSELQECGGIVLIYKRSIQYQMFKKE